MKLVHEFWKDTGNHFIKDEDSGISSEMVGYGQLAILTIQEGTFLAVTQAYEGCGLQPETIYKLTPIKSE